MTIKFVKFNLNYEIALLHFPLNKEDMPKDQELMDLEL